MSKRSAFMRGLKRFGASIANLLVFAISISLLQVPMHGRVSDSVAAVVIIASSLVAYSLGVRWIERREVSELNPRTAVRETVVGTALGAALFVILIAVLKSAGVYQVNGYGGLPAVSTVLLAMTTAVVEEIVFRGLIQRLLTDLFGSWIAILTCSGLFGIAHAFNPGATRQSTICIAVEAGLLLSAAYASSKTLWMPIGIHFGWNVVEGEIFGFAVSGHTAHASAVAGTLRGPVWLTGGGFGPEASLVAPLICGVAAVWFLWRMRVNRNPEEAAVGAAIHSGDSMLSGSVLK